MNRPRQTQSRSPRDASRYMQLFREWERSMLLQHLRHHRNNQCAVARELGLHRNTVRRMMIANGLRGTEER